MLILGIESSCDETSASVAEMDENNKIIRSNIVASQIETHKLYGGVVPEIASRAHIEAVSGITYQALAEAGVELKDIDCIAVTSHPGLIGALLVGVNFAKSLAYANNIPLVAVNHIHAHVGAAYFAQPDLKPPYLAVVVSGGHTSIYRADSHTEYEEIGATRDDAAGESFDKVGRVIGLPYPGGAALDKLAYEGSIDAYKLPSPAIPGDSLDFSFSGIKTAALNIINSAQQKGEELDRAGLAASYTNAVVNAITKKVGLAIETTGYKTVVMAGGVAANSHLRKNMEKTCTEHGAKLVMPKLSLCGDNGAMVAAAGYFEYLEKHFSDTSLNASAAD